jgi:uncharacterized protein YbaP (TraB family)
MLFKKIPLLLSCSLLLLTAKAQQQPKEKSSLLWEISGKELKSPSWLYGTIHMLCPQDLHFSTATLDALKQSKSLYLEINMEDQQEMQELQSALVMPEGYSFKNLMTEAEYEQLSAWCRDSMHIDLSMLDRLKPLVLITLVSKQYFTAACKEPASCELEFIKLAKAQQLPVRGLEKVSDQLAIFDSIPDKEEVQIILRTINESDKSRDLYQRMRLAYTNQDISALSDLMAETEDMVKYKDILLDNRNRNWISTITGEAGKASTFFAVGAGHLGGNAGVIALLRKEGYTVKAVQ